MRLCDPQESGRLIVIHSSTAATGSWVLIHPVEQAPKAILLNHAIPTLNRLLTDCNATLPQFSRPQRQLRLRAVMHAGEIHYDSNGCFGHALDIAFRLLDAPPVKKALRMTSGLLALVVSGDIYRSVVHHGYNGIDRNTFREADPESARKSRTDRASARPSAAVRPSCRPGADGEGKRSAPAVTRNPISIHRSRLDASGKHGAISMRCGIAAEDTP